MRKKKHTNSKQNGKERWNERRTNEQIKKETRTLFSIFNAAKKSFFFSSTFFFDWKCAMRQINERKKEISLLHPFRVRFKYAYPKKWRRIAEVTTTTATITERTEQNAKECSAFGRGKKAWTELNWIEEMICCAPFQKGTKDSLISLLSFVDLLLILSIIFIV